MEVELSVVVLGLRTREQWSNFKGASADGSDVYRALPLAAISVMISASIWGPDKISSFSSSFGTNVSNKLLHNHTVRSCHTCINMLESVV